VSVRTNMSGSADGVRVDGSVTPDMVVPAVLELVSQYASDPRRPGRAWPPCPGHDHALQLEAIGDEAVWVCPLYSDVRFRIGQLPTP